MLVRMMCGGRVKYLPSEGVRLIVEVPVEGGRPTCVVRYRIDDPNDDWGEEVDGTPDEVFKALFNPPDVVEKSMVAAALDILEATVNEAKFGRGPLDNLNVFIERVRYDLGVVRKR